MALCTSGRLAPACSDARVLKELVHATRPLYRAQQALAAALLLFKKACRTRLTLPVASRRRCARLLKPGPALCPGPAFIRVRGGRVAPERARGTALSCWGRWLSAWLHFGPRGAHCLCRRDALDQRARVAFKPGVARAAAGALDWADRIADTKVRAVGIAFLPAVASILTVLGDVRAAQVARPLHAHGAPQRRMPESTSGQ